MLTSLITLADGLDKLGCHEASNALDSLLKYAANRGDAMPRYKEMAMRDRAAERAYDLFLNSEMDPDKKSKMNETKRRQRDSVDKWYEELLSTNTIPQRRTGQRLADQHEIERSDREELARLNLRSEIDHFNDEIRAEEIADEQEDDASDNRSDSMPLYKEYAELMRKSDRIKQRMDKLSANSEEFYELDAKRNAIHDRIDSIADGIQSETYPYRMTGRRAQDFVNERMIPDEFRLPE